jgi:hypothetical protein
MNHRLRLGVKVLAVLRSFNANFPATPTAWIGKQGRKN